MWISLYPVPAALRQMKSAVCDADKGGKTLLKLSIQEDTDALEERLDCLVYLSKHRVDVGLPSAASARSRTLLAIHEHGSPAMHIPARPVVQPALSRASVRADMAAGLAEACAAAMDGDLSGTKAGLEKAGQAGADGIRAYIDAGIPPPNAPVTLTGGWIRNPVSGKPVHIEGKSGSTPLVDTGQLRAEFGYEITER